MKKRNFVPIFIAMQMAVFCIVAASGVVAWKDCAKSSDRYMQGAIREQIESEIPHVDAWFRWAPTGGWVPVLSVDAP